MPTATYDLRLNNTTWSVFPTGVSQGSGSATPASLDVVSFLPARWLPREQEYYWTEAWQADEIETLKSLAEGGAIRFDSAQDLILWLVSTDDD